MISHSWCHKSSIIWVITADDTHLQSAGRPTQRITSTCGWSAWWLWWRLARLCRDEGWLNGCVDGLLDSCDGHWLDGCVNNMLDGCDEGWMVVWMECRPCSMVVKGCLDHWRMFDSMDLAVVKEMAVTTVSHGRQFVGQQIERTMSISNAHNGGNNQTITSNFADKPLQIGMRGPQTLPPTSNQ